MPPVRRPIINLRERIENKESLVVDMTRLNHSENDTRRFLRLLAAWVDVHKRELGDHEENHVSSVQKAHQTIKELKVTIEETKASAEALLHTIDSQQTELQKLQDAVAEERERKRKAQSNLTMLTTEIEQVKASIARIRAEQEAEQRILDDQVARVTPELSEYQRLLRMRVDPVPDLSDVLQVSFSAVDPTNYDREFSVILDVSQDDYRAPNSQPLLPALPTLIETLNRDRDYFSFLKQLRMAFVQYVKDERGGRV